MKIPDITLRQNEVYLRIEPNTKKATDWIERNVSREGFNPEYPVLFVEHNYAEPLLYAMKDYGLTGKFGY